VHGCLSHAKWPLHMHLLHPCSSDSAHLGAAQHTERGGGVTRKDPFTTDKAREWASMACFNSSSQHTKKACVFPSTRTVTLAWTSPHGYFVVRASSPGPACPTDFGRCMPTCAAASSA
jgi:hypothetical protein